MMFRKPLWLFGAAMSLESMRRGFVGGTALALFIDLSGLEPPSTIRDLGFLRRYLEVEEWLITMIPPFLSFLVAPFIDYHKANCLFLEICDLLALARRETTCAPFWEK